MTYLHEKWRRLTIKRIQEAVDMQDRAVSKLKMMGYEVYEHTKGLCIAYTNDYSRLIIYKYGNKEFDTADYKLNTKNYNLRLSTVDKLVIIDLELPGECMLIHIDSFNNIIIKTGDEYGSISVYEDEYVWAAREEDNLSLYNKRTKCRYRTKCNKFLKFNMSKIGGTRNGKVIGNGMYIDINRQFDVKYERIQTTLTNKNEKVLVMSYYGSNKVIKLTYLMIEDEVYKVLSSDRATHPMNSEIRAKKILSTSLDSKKDLAENTNCRIEIQGHSLMEYTGRTPNKTSIFMKRGL